MDNDNKISQVVNQAKSNFLKGEVVDTTREVIEYSLDKEFSKSKKNRRVLIVWSVLIFLGLMAGAAFFTVYMIQQKQTNVQVDIADFEDLKLTELLKNASTDKSRIKFLEQDIKQIVFQKNQEIEQIKGQTEQLIQIAKQKGLSKPEENAEVAMLQKQGSAKIAAISQKYDSKISMKKEEIDDLKMSLKDKDDTGDVAQEAGVYSEYEKIFEIRLEKTKQYYDAKIKEINNQHLKDISQMQKLNQQLINVLILKYNPVFKEEAVKALIAAKFTAVGGMLGEYNTLLAKENIMSKADFDAMKQKNANFSTIYSRVYQIPYTNSVPSAIAGIKFFHDSAIKDYDALWQKALKMVEKKNKLIDTYEYAFEYYTKIGRETGYVLDPRDPKKMVVYMNKAYLIKKGDTAIVFRNDDEYIGKIKLDPQADAVLAEVIELAEGEQILPLDRILINIKQ